MDLCIQKCLKVLAGARSIIGREDCGAKTLGPHC